MPDYPKQISIAKKRQGLPLVHGVKCYVVDASLNTVSVSLLGIHQRYGLTPAGRSVRIQATRRVRADADAEDWYHAEHAVLGHAAQNAS